MWRNLYPEFGSKTLAPKFSIGDHVRITKEKTTFDKGYTQRWTEEVFKTCKIQLTIPVTYKITDYNGEEIQVRFMNKNFKKTEQDIFRIANRIKQQGNKSLLKWLGSNDFFNSKVDNKDINKLKTLTNYRAKVHNVRSGSPPVVGLAIFASTM